MSRLISLIGYRAVAPDTLGTRRRRSTLGLKLLFWGVTAMLAYFSIQMSAEAIGPEVLILAFVVYLAMHAPVYEITYDRDTSPCRAGGSTAPPANGAILMPRWKSRAGIWSSISVTARSFRPTSMSWAMPNRKKPPARPSARSEMPELPEVETVRRGLLPVMEGRLIAHAQVNRPDLRWPLPDRMAERLTGQRVLALRRRSKYLLADLSSGESLLVHLGMSGRMLVSGAMLGTLHHDHPAPQKHDHVVLTMDSGARITFNDARRFGAMDLLQTAGAETHPLLASLGPEPLGNTFDDAYLTAALKGRRTPIKAALLDQHLVAGLGNIYVCEVLFRARISPQQLAGELSANRTASLVPIIREVLAEAIEAGGSSLRDHRQTSGELGYFQHAFRVYDREGQPCTTPGCTGTIARIVQSGRSTFFCPRCQR